MEFLAAHTLPLPLSSPGAANYSSAMTMMMMMMNEQHDHETPDSASSRLLTMANYETFQPTALACRHGVTAVAGRNGIAVFPTAAPQRPHVLLSHAARELPSALAFSTQHHHLASARGSGVYIWDVSSGSVSPLMGRLGSQPIHDMMWWNESSVLTASDSTASLWDWRSGMTAIRFGAQRQMESNSTHSCQNYQYVQIAAPATAIGTQQSSSVVALMERSGLVRVFDLRTKREKSQFQAFRSIGVGLSYLDSRQAWVTWGLDDIQSDAVVKLFSSDHESVPSSDASYWFMQDTASHHGLTGGSVETPATPPNYATTSLGVSHRILCAGTTPNLACARPCPSPIDGGLVTLGLIPIVDDPNGNYDWQADFWNVKPGLMERVVSFSESIDNNEEILSLVDSPDKLRRVIASEVTLAPYSEDDNAEYGLVLCTLTQQGFVFTHGIPEAMPLRPHDSVSSTKHRINDSSHWTGLPANLIAKDPARLWGKSDDASQAVNDGGNNKASDNALFDIDIPVAVAGSNDDPASESTEIAAGEQGKIEIVQSDIVADDKKSFMANIPTEKIPCPRLCSATFCFGTGNIVAFNNGDVGRSWAWWLRSTLVVEKPRARINVMTMISSIAGTPESQVSSVHTDMLRYPRTLKDLLNLTLAAKEAHWRENDEGDSSSNDDGPITEIHYFSDDSDGSSDEEEDETAIVDQITSNRRSLYNSNFSDSIQKPNDNYEEDVRNSNDLFHGNNLQNDLAPVVKVFRAQSNLALSNQLESLACLWDVGSFSDHDVLTLSHSDGAVLIPDNPRKTPLSPLLKQPLRNKATEENGVRGGEYSTKPNVHDNYSFLRKFPFFPQQQEMPGSPNPKKSARLASTSPRGKHLVNFYQESSSMRRTRSDRAHGLESSPSGVYVKRKSKGFAFNVAISNIHQKCINNAAIADGVKQFDKGDSWRWIATLVEEVLQRSSSYDVDAWDSLSSGKFGKCVIDNILRYYEVIGDVQMLASIVCVLKSSCLSGGKTTRFTFLQNDWDRYNSYIKMYSELLYSWGHLTKCAEIKKFRFAESGSENISSPTAMTDKIDLIFKCPRCHSSSESGTNYCNSCHDYAMRCSICDMAVRGLFSVCERCVSLPFAFSTNHRRTQLRPRWSCKPFEDLVRREQSVPIWVWLHMQSVTFFRGSSLTAATAIIGPFITVESPLESVLTLTPSSISENQDCCM